MRPTGLDVFIYLRKSRKDLEREQKVEYDTLERHRKQLLELVKKENHNLVAPPFEEVVSGEYINERPKIQELLKEVEDGAVDGVLVMDLDRLGRGDMFDMGLIYRAFTYSETLVITPTEVIDPTEDGAELLFGVKSILSREELKSINKRLQRGRRASASEGKFIGKKPPYGYLRNEKMKLVPDPETAWVVKLIFEKMAEGYGRHALARYLDEHKIPPPERADQWEHSTLTAIIKNEVYTGTIIWGKTKQYKRNGKRVRKKMPRENWIIKENAHEPIISKELFDRANEAHSSRWRPPMIEPNTLTNPLAGLLRCSICGRVMKYQPNRDRPNHHIRCYTRTCAPFHKGAGLHLVMDKVIESLSDILESIEFEGELLERKKVSLIPEKERALKEHQSALQKAQTQKDNLHDLLEQGVYTIETFMKRQQAITERIKNAQDKIAQLEKEIAIEREKENHYDQFLPKAKSALKAFHETENAFEQNKLLKSIIDKIEYTRKKDWVEPDHFEIKIYLKI
jgi:site-specific DNA recombinase